MIEKRTTLIEIVGDDLNSLADEVRDIVSYGVWGDEEQIERLVYRATNPNYLGKDATPKPEDTSIFVNAIFQRYVEAADALGAEHINERNIMLARVALAVDALRGIEWDELSEQYEDLPALKKQGAYIGWLSMISDSARMIRDDLGIQPPKRKKREPKKIDKDTHAPNSDVIPGFEDLRSVVVDLVYDERAPTMTRDHAAALLVAFGTDIPRREISFEKRNEYKRRAMHWLAKKLSYDKPALTEESDDREKLQNGYEYLERIVKQYPIGSNDLVTQWLASRDDIMATPSHIESHIAFALHDLLVEKNNQIENSA